MKRDLLNLQRVVMSIRHLLPFFLFILASLNVKAQCTVNVTPVTTNICPGDSVMMECIDPLATTFQWYKDGGKMAGSISSIFYAKEAGDYTVETDVCNSFSNPVHVTLKPNPIISISATSLLLCNGQQVTLTVFPGSGVDTWGWLAPSSIMFSNTNPLTVMLTEPTTFQAIGANTTFTKCAAIASITVDVLPLLKPGAIHSNSQICPGETPPPITSEPATGASGSYIYQWQWSTTSASTGFTDIPGVPPSSTPDSYQPPITDQTTVTTWYRLKISSLPCEPKYSGAVVVQMDKNPTVISDPAKAICTGDNVNYQPVSDVTGATFTWTAAITSAPGSVLPLSATSGTGKINEILSLPSGASVSGEVTYTIIPTGPSSSFCPSISVPMELIVTVYPIAEITNAALSQDICAGTTSTPVVLQSNIPSATYTWIATGTVGLSGFPTTEQNTDVIPAMKIDGLLSAPGKVTITVTPSVPGGSCAGTPMDYVINVNPSPAVTNILEQTICTGEKTSLVTLTSNVPTTLNWDVVTPLAVGVSGVLISGANTIAEHIITNTSTVQAVVTYRILPASVNGCAGIPADYSVKVNPKPNVTVPSLTYIVCSGETTNIPLTSNVAGTTFSWTATSIGGGVMGGFSDDKGTVIAQTLTNGSNADHNVTYKIKPTSNGCDGSEITVVVTVHPNQVLTIIPSSPATCSGIPVVINLEGNDPEITFEWTASTTGDVTGFDATGTGSTISQTLTNNDNVTQTVVYAVVMTLKGCKSGATNFNVTVFPTPKITNSPLNATLCSGSTFNLALTSNVAASDLTYTWLANSTPVIPINTSGIGNTINETISNTTSAPAIVSYHITPSSNGCTGTPADFKLTVNPIPSVNLSPANQSICSGTTTTQVDFTSTVLAGTTSFKWVATPSGAGITGFTASADPATSILSQTINSTLSNQGTVTYEVTPEFEGCIGSKATHIVTINPRPTVLNDLSQTICSGSVSQIVHLSSNVVDPNIDYSWSATASAGVTNFISSGTGNTIPEQIIYNNPPIQGTPGTVTYKITPISKYGPACAGLDADYVITVNPLPEITSSLSEAVCSGAPFTYTITSNPTGSFTWSRAKVPFISNEAASGSSASFTETLVNLTASDIDVQYILTPKGPAPTYCDGIPVTLTVKVRALPQVNAGADFHINYGTYTNLNGTASGTSALTYTWTPNSYIGSGPNTLTPQTVQLINNQTYTLSTQDLSGCSAVDEMIVIIDGAPIAAVPISSPTEICVGESATINANATGGNGGYTYSWTSQPVGFTSTNATITVSPSIDTKYFVTVYDGYNYSVPVSVTTTVNPLPLKYDLTGGGSYCAGGPGVALGLAGSETGVSYQLYNNGNPVGIPVVGSGTPFSFGNQTLAGGYTVVATSPEGCTQSMGNNSVAINELPVANAGADQNNNPFGTSTTLNGSVSGGVPPTGYSWGPAAFIASGGATSTPVTTKLYSNTTFTLEVTDSNGCKDTDDMVVASDGTAIKVNISSVPAQICADASQAQLNASITGGDVNHGYTYSWTSDPAGWTSTEQSPMVSPDVTTTYTVVANDGSNTATASATIKVNPLPDQFGIMGGGSYCYAGSGTEITLSGSQANTNYQLYRGIIADGPAVQGDGFEITFGNRTAEFTYTVIATNNTSGCQNQMNGSATVDIIDPPSSYLVTGGGSYPIGGPGRTIGLNHADAGISYQLYFENVAVGLPQTGAEDKLDFGLQTEAGIYTVIATDLLTGCTADMTGSVKITILASPANFDVTGGGTICEGEPGLTVMLSGSETGMDYQLIFDGFPMGALKAGTNNQLFWGPFTTAGIYEVRAVHPIYGTTQMMYHDAVIIVNPLPTIFSVDPTGSQCPGTIIRLNGSESNVNYSLLVNGVEVDAKAGTGIVEFLDFGARYMTGTYTIKAVNIITGCEAMMNGSTFINIPPQISNVMPAGILCPGQEIILSGSQTGVNYQLRWNGTFDLGTPIAGTGSSLSMGNAGLPGTYSVVAIDAVTNCVSYMNDSATLYPDPTAFTIEPDGTACEGESVRQNGSELGVDYVLLLDNAIHVDTIHGDGNPINFGPQSTAGNYSIIAINQFSYCIFNMNGTTVMNDSPIKYEMMPAGIQCIGNSVVLSNSQTGVTYQLMLDGIYNMGAPVAGTGSALDFGTQSLTGTYTVRAVNDVTGCNSMMSDSTVFEPLPVVFATIPSGSSHCAGTIVGLDGSEINFNYILVLDGTINLDTIAGTGSPIAFGPQVTAGTYSVVAYNTVSFCSIPMSSSTFIEASPVAFNMTPAGSSCIGANLGLENSEIGITYQLRWNGSINVGTPVAGTGSAISLGTHNLTGTYSVVATNANGCITNMSSTVVVSPLPVAFNIIPSGTQCQGTVLGLDGSEVNVNYILVLDGNVLTDTISGTGSTISFGPQLTSGNYTVLAYFTATSCQSLMNGTSIISDVAPTIYTMTPAGIICAGATIGVDNSEIGAFYQLRLNGTINMGTPIAGTGSAISFGVQTVSGIYTSISTNANGCHSLMTGNVEMNPNPKPFSITPNGVRCPGTAIGIDGSEAGIKYILVLNGAINIDTLTGNGLPLSFNAQTTSGTYEVVAYNAMTLCQTTMNGNTVINPAPIAYDLTPAGISCTGITIGIEDSEAGVLYQLRRNGTINMGAPVAGTGEAFDFGIQSLPGTYTVEAAGINGCTSMMNDSVVVHANPLVFTQSPTGSQCPGTAITLNGSETGISYVLLRNGIFHIDTLKGNGSVLNFGAQMISGNYIIVAFSDFASCPSFMNGNTTILVGPTAYNVTPAGIICAGSTVGIDGSEMGVSYQLRRDGTTNVGTPMSGTGSAISFGNINIAGTYSVVATSNSNGCSTSMNDTAVLQPMPVAFSLTTPGTQCAGTSILLNGSQTGVEYILVRDNSINIDTISGTGTVIDFGPQTATGLYTIEAINGTSGCKSEMNGTIQMENVPAAFNITPVGITCFTAVVGLDGSETGVKYTLYKNGINTGITQSGTGDTLSFGKVNYGTFTIKAVNSTTGCSVMMPGSLLISNPPVVHSGSDVTICASQPVTLNATVSVGGVSTWSTSGDGVFGDINVLNTLYTPGSTDLATGIVSLILTTNGIGSCAATFVSDTIQVIINQPAIAYAGGNQDDCTSGGYTIQGASATNFNAVSWLSSGTGTLANGNSLTPTYTPSEADITAGSINLIMQVNGNSPCSNTANDAITLTFHPAITVDAGPDATINFGDTFAASSATVLNSASVLWSTTGTGTFNNSSFVNATYTPSNDDFAKGSVVLSISTINNAPCSQVTDDLTLTLTNNWSVEFAWGSTCEAQPVAFSVNPTTTNISAVQNWLWNFGDGNTSVSMNPTHIFPGIGGYDVTLTLTDTLGNVKVNSHHIIVSQFPVSFFKNSVPNCSNEPVIFTELAHTVYGKIDKWIWNYGDGTDNDTIQFPDQPNVAHLYNAAGTFNVTLTVANSFGCLTPATIPVEVIEAPITNFQYNDDCSGLETSFRDASYANGPGNTVQYWWNFGDPATGADNTSDLKDATHIFSAPGIYHVTHVVRNFNNCTDTIVKPVTILTPVPVAFTYEHTCMDGIANFGPDTSVMSIANTLNWAWDFGDGVTNNQAYTHHVYAAPGSYKVTLTVNDISGCTAYKTRTVVVNPLPVALFNTTQLPCANAPVHFDDASSAYAGYITKWNWDFGDGTSQQVLHPANPDIDHTYSTSGTYQVTLTLFSSDSCTAERTETIEVNPAPIAYFDVTNACQGTSAQFTDLSQTNGAGIIKGWVWNFGDGASGANNISSLRNAEHTYTSNGTYQVSLTVQSANGCSSTFVKTVVITDAPFVDFSYDNHCAATVIQFTNASGLNSADIKSWNWSFGDGLTSGTANPQHKYSTPGDYTVTLTITNIAGCENTISHNLTILPLPVSNFTTSTPACSQYQVAFTDQSSAPVGYIMRWEYNFGDGTSTVVDYPNNPSVTHSYTTYGNFHASLTVVTNDNCSATTSKSVKILPSPLANFSYNVSCLEVPVQFNDLSQGSLISWAWNFADPGSLSNNTSSLRNPTHLFKQAGDYKVTLFVQNANGCYDTVTRTISISPKPAVDFSFNTGCASDTVHFNSSMYVNAASIASWVWQFGDNTMSVDADPNHIYATPGTYNVSLTITNQNGCTNVKTRQVQVTTAPIAMFTPNSLSCSGTAVLFTDLSSTPNGTIDTWSWNFDDGNESVINAPSNGDATHSFETAGIYRVTLSIRTSTGCEASYTKVVTINSAPVTAFTYTSSCSELPTSFTDQSQGSGGNSISGWNWNFGDPASGVSNISTLRNPQHFFSKTGTYRVTLTTENTLGCSSSVMQILIIKSLPSVNFTESVSCNGSPVRFSADPAVTNIAAVASYLWDFGDGTTPSVMAEPNHVFATAGTYNVTLTITNLTGCQNSTSHPVTIHALPNATFTYSSNCAANLVQFTDKSYNPGGEKIVAWAWDFGVSTTIADTSSKQNPTYNFATPGTYNVTLTITSALGCSVVKTIPVTVMDAPEAAFSYIAEPCRNGSVMFKDESISNQSVITSWYWEFAPGEYSTLQNPTHTFGHADTCYNVKLIITTATGCSNTLIKSVCIPEGIEVAINYTQACFGETTWFSSALVNPAGGNITSYNWNFGDPTTGYSNESNLASPQHTFSKPGMYYVSLRVSDPNNCSTTKYISIMVDALPKADFSHVGGTCDSLVSFKDMTSGINIAQWIWNFGDGKSKTVDAPSNPNVSHYYTYPGVYEVTLIVQSESGCYDTIRKTIRRTPCIAAAFKVSDPVVCVKRSMNFTETSTCQAPIASWTWYFGDNTSATFTSPQQAVEHTYAASGNYTVKMVVASQMVGGMATDTASSQVAVKPAATASYKWQDVCVGNSTTFDNLSQNNNTTIKSYLWNFGDPGTLADTTSATNAEYRYDVYGQYEVKLVVTNTLGCTDTLINKINIFESPAADFTWNNSCEAKPVVFSDQSKATSSNIVKWNWRFSNAGELLEGSTQKNCTFSFAKAGIYDADMMITDLNGCSTTVKKQVTVSPNPVAAFSIIENYENKQGQIMISNGSINATNNVWEISNGKTSFGSNPIITFDKEGHYIIQLTTSNDQNCTDTLSMEYNFMYKGLYVPNAFNPGHNDPEVAVFKPKGSNLKLYNVGVYDRWGNLLWSSNKIDENGSPAESWDGTLHGEVLKQDVYVWKITAQFRDGEVWDGTNAGNNDKMPQQKAGTVTLIR